MCKMGEVLIESGAKETALSIMDTEKRTISKLALQAPFYKSVAETQIKAGNREAAKQSYIDIDAVEKDLGNWPDYIKTPRNYQEKIFLEAIESYVKHCLTEK